MNKLFFVFCVLFASIAAAQAPDWAWAKRPEGTGSSASQSVVADINGNVYVTGSFSNDVILGNDTLVSTGGVDIFIAKYSSVGGVLWAKQYGGIVAVAPLGIKIDSIGNLLVYGSLGQHIPVVKYNASGDTIWVGQSLIGSSQYNVQGIASDVAGNVYLTGYFKDSIIIGNDTLRSSSYKEIFLAKYSGTTGAALWAKRAGSSKQDDDSYGVSVDRWGNVYIAGYVRDTAYFDNVMYARTGAANMYLAKYDSAGNIIWVTGTVQPPATTSLALFIKNDKSGNIYLTGQFSDTVYFGTHPIVATGNQDEHFLAKYNNSGQALWVKNTGMYRYAGDVAIDDSGNVYATHTANGVSVTKFSPAGDEYWTQSPTNFTFTSNHVSLDGICIDGSNNIYVSGSFKNSVSFGNTTLSGNTDWHMFIAKLPPFATNVQKPNKTGGSVPIAVSPNPARDMLAIDMRSNKYTLLKIYDQLGRVMYEGAAATQVKQVNISNLTSGIYYLQVSGNGTEPQTKKIIVQR